MGRARTFSIVVGVAGALGGWWLKVMWEALLTQRIETLEYTKQGE